MIFMVTTTAQPSCNLAVSIYTTRGMLYTDHLLVFRGGIDMRRAVLVVCVMLILVSFPGLVLHNHLGEQKRASSALLSWVEDFDDGNMNEFYVSYDDTDGGNANDYGNLVEVSMDQYVSGSYSLHVRSLNLNGASVARALVHSGYIEDWETLLNYTVSTSFLFPGTDNHWFVVLKTTDVHLVLVGDMLMAHSLLSSETKNVTQLNISTWYGIRCEVTSFSGEYEVIINGTSYGWYNATGGLTYPKITSFGDLDDSLSPDSRGEGYWDDLRLVYHEMEIGPTAHAGPDKTADVGENVDFFGEGIGSLQNDTWETHPFGWDDWIDVWPSGTNLTEFKYSGQIYAGLVAVEYFSGRAIYAPGNALAPRWVWDGVTYQLLINSVEWASRGKAPSSTNVLFVWGHEELTTYASGKWNGPSAVSSEGYNVNVQELIPANLSAYDVVIMLSVGWTWSAKVSQQGYNHGWCSVTSSGCPKGNAPTPSEVNSLLDFVANGGGVIASAEKSDGHSYLNDISTPMGVHFLDSPGVVDMIWAEKTTPSHPILSRWEGIRAPIVSWLWDFGDGSPQFSGRNSSHIYTTPGTYNVTLTIVDSLGLTASDNCLVYVTSDNLSPVADAGPDRRVDEGDDIQFNGTASYDPDGNVTSYEWDFDADTDSDGDGNPSNDIDAVGPAPTHTYGDDGIFVVTLTVRDDYGADDSDIMNVTVDNVAPNISSFAPYVNASLFFRIAGEKWHNVEIHLYRDGMEIGYASITRYPGSPNDQMVELINLSVDLSGSYSIVAYYTPEDDPVNGQVWGATPAWVIIDLEDGSERIHHTFNVRHEETWTWTIDNLSLYFVGHNITFSATASDPGSDDLIFTWDWGDGSSTVHIYYNDGVGPDPYPSPSVNPVAITEIALHAYSMGGAYTVMVSVCDDDGGMSTTVIVIFL